MAAVGVTIDGFTRQEIIKIIQSIAPSEDTGATSGGGSYRGESQAIATTENTLAAAKTGPVVGDYDPELAAYLSGEL